MSQNAIHAAGLRKKEKIITFRRDVLKKRMESTDYFIWLALMKSVQRLIGRCGGH